MVSRWALQLAAVLTIVLVGSRSCPGQSTAGRSPTRDSAFTLEQEGRTVEAESAWEEIVKADPKNAEAYAHLGFLESQQQHYNTAVASYRKAFALEPSMPGLRLNLGLASFKAGDLKESIRTLEPMFRTEPPSSPNAQRLRILLGMAHYGLGQYGEAIAYLKEAMAHDPQNLPYRLVLAESCLRSGKYQCVLDVYHQILMLNAESAEADMLAGEALDEMGDHPAAIQQFRAAVKADPKVPNEHFGLGYLLWCQEQYPEAADQFQAELNNIPDNAEAMAYLADSYIHLNQHAAARPLLEKAVQLDPRLEMGYLDLGVLDATAGNNAQALREFKTATRLQPADVQAHWRLGRLYRAMGKEAEAKAEIDQTKNLNKAKDESVFKKLRHSSQDGDGAIQETAPPS